MSLFSNAPFEVVCPFDPAIDNAGSDLDNYAEVRDMKFLKFTPGKEPTVYVIRRLPGHIDSVIGSQASSDFSRYQLSFMAGVIAVKNLYGTDGAFYPAWKPTWCSTLDSDAQSMTQAEFNLFPRDEVQDIGSVVWARSDLRPGKPVCFVAPPSSGVSLGKKDRSSHRAALSDFPSSKPSEAAVQPLQPSSSDGEKDGAVIAPVQ